LGTKILGIFVLNMLSKTDWGSLFFWGTWISFYFCELYWTCWARL